MGTDRTNDGRELAASDDASPRVASDPAPLGEQQREALLSMGLLAAGLVHEVKNSLTGVIGLLQLVQRDDVDTGTAQEQYSRLERELRDCVDRLNRFLSLRPDGAAIQRTPVCDSREAIDEATGLVRHAFQMKGIRLNVALAEGLPLVPIALIDLRGALVNLLLNAMQALGGEGTVAVSLRARSAGGVEIDVVDDGPGVAPDYQARIFEPLVTTRPSGEGTGLGLHIVRGLIEAAGGKVWLDPETSQGARFVIELPQRARTQPPITGPNP